jgi:hypothetical protein
MEETAAMTKLNTHIANKKRLSKKKYKKMTKNTHKKSGKNINKIRKTKIMKKIKNRRKTVKGGFTGLEIPIVVIFFIVSFATFVMYSVKYYENKQINNNQFNSEFMVYTKDTETLGDYITRISNNNFSLSDSNNIIAFNYKNGSETLKSFHHMGNLLKYRFLIFLNSEQKKLDETDQNYKLINNIYLILLYRILEKYLNAHVNVNKLFKLTKGETFEITFSNNDNIDKYTINKTQNKNISDDKIFNEYLNIIYSLFINQLAPIEESVQIEESVPIEMSNLMSIKYILYIIKDLNREDFIKSTIVLETQTDNKYKEPIELSGNSILQKCKKIIESFLGNENNKMFEGESYIDDCSKNFNLEYKKHFDNVINSYIPQKFYFDETSAEQIISYMIYNGKLLDYKQNRNKQAGPLINLDGLGNISDIDYFERPDEFEEVALRVGGDGDDNNNNTYNVTKIIKANLLNLMKKLKSHFINNEEKNITTLIDNTEDLVKDAIIYLNKNEYSGKSIIHFVYYVLDRIKKYIHDEDNTIKNYINKLFYNKDKLSDKKLEIIPETEKENFNKKTFEQTENIINENNEKVLMNIRSEILNDEQFMKV